MYDATEEYIDKVKNKSPQIKSFGLKKMKSYNLLYHESMKYFLK
jgi:hypothetical protein